MQTRYFGEATWLTLQETLLGFAAGTLGGLMIGALTGTFQLFRTALWPFVVAFQNTPRVALAPVLLTWFGFGMTSKVVMAAVICFFPVVINTVAGLASVDDNARTLFRTYGASTSQTDNVNFALLGSADLAVAATKRDDVRVLFCHQAHNVYRIAALADSGIADLDGFKGKTLDITEPGGGENALVKTPLEDAARPTM